MMLDQVELHRQARALDGRDEVARRHAIQALRRHQEADWAKAPAAVCQGLVVALRQHLHDSAGLPLVLKDVATILGNIGPRSKSAVPQLIGLLREEVPEPVRESAVIALGKFGEEARPAVDGLLELCKHHGPLTNHALRAICQIGCADHRIRSGLADLWRAPNLTEDIRLETALAVCRLGFDVEGLLSYLTHRLVADQDKRLRKTIAEALAKRDKRELDVVPALLIVALVDKDDEVRQAAETALGELRLTRESAIVVCAKQLGAATHAETALCKSGRPAVGALVEIIGSKDAAVRIAAARICGGLGELALEAAPALAGALKDRNVDVRLIAAKALWNITKLPDLAVPALIKLLEEPVPPVFDSIEARRRFLQTVIEALWRIGSPAKAALPALAQKAKDQNRLVRESALNAMKKIAPSATP
jgi:HEAT repeat protein